jgi:hypothetical protein
LQYQRHRFPKVHADWFISVNRISVGVNVFLYSLSHADSLFHGIPEGFIKRADTFIPFHDLQIDFDAAFVDQSTLGEPNQPRANAVLAKCRSDSHRIDPAAMPVVSGHRGANDFSANQSNKEEPIIDCKLLIDDE